MFIDHISLDRAVSSATLMPGRDPNSYPNFGYSPETGFPRDAKKIFEKYEGKFKRIAASYAWRTGLDEADLFAVVQLGAVRAASTYDSSQGAFWTYAQWQIRAHVNEYLSRNVTATRVRMNDAEKRTFRRLPAMLAVKGVKSIEALSAAQLADIAQSAGVTAKRLLELTRQRQPAVSLNTPIGDEDGSVTLGDVMQADPFGDYIGDKGARRVVGGSRQAFENYAEDILIEAIDRTTVRAQRRALLRRALATLNERERAIVEGRHGEGEPAPLATFAERFGISVERVRQIETKALAKVGKHMRGNTACSRSTAEATRLPPPKDELVTRHQPAGTVKVPARNVVVGTFCFSDAIPGEFDAPMRAQIARTQKRAQAEQAERRARRMRAIAAVQTHGE